MQYRLATYNDIPTLLQLHKTYHVESIDENLKKDGFVTTQFTEEQMKALIDEQGVSIAVKDNEVLAYVMAASWTFWSQWPMFAYMIQHLDRKSYNGHQLSIENSYQYGPICIHESLRGTDVLYRIFEFSRTTMEPRFPVLITFINKINGRSFKAHQKLGLEVINEFEWNNNQYYELAYPTEKPIQMPN
ncbi:MAG TPA: GNAT family acetyltransferase [Gammaproteobacteria bacterium]|nr:GNAT family acetyltransferase [Gammaproteobacteria bacterium]HBF09845.1 GNAT family acetyltransferase [Gammaproteobacteria bacterium]HCK91976.1 GNAT family acetyltransferase [Gammaproteobacteria bacterium]|tara:strand:+ start:24011 stop:24574 length:564 start_codon:yes stop_codon:yes gene_type:complete